MKKVKLCKDCKEKCPRPSNRRENGVCTEIIPLLDQWEVVRDFQEDGYPLTEEMLFQLQKRGYGPNLYLTNEELLSLWEIQLDIRKEAEIVLRSPEAHVSLEMSLDSILIDKPIEEAMLPLLFGPVKTATDLEPFDWEDRPELIGFYFHDDVMGRLEIIKKGFYPVHVFLPIPTKEISKRREELKKEMNPLRKEEARNCYFFRYFKRRSAEGIPHYKICKELSKLYKEATGLTIKPDSIKNEIHNYPKRPLFP